MEPKIAVLGTGGTLAGSGGAPQDNLAYRAGTMAIADLLARIPALQGPPLVAEQVAQIDSKDMSLEIWRTLALRCAHWLARDDIAGVVIAHGTDTLEETAFFLQSVLAPAKPVVLTCAMRPATATFPDGPQNLVDAVAVASTAGARGVVAVCAGLVHGAADVAKRHTYRLDAFSSGDAGPIGHVEERRLRQVRPWPDGEPAPALLQRFDGGPVPWPRVEIVMSHAGAGRGLVDALVAQGVAGLVVAGTGNCSLHHELEAGLLDAQAQGVRVVRSTRCAEGRVLATPHDTLPHAGALSPPKARIALLLELLLRTTAPA
jgi:L-asparaginase